MNESASTTPSATAEAILRAAARIFAREGYRAATVQAIATEAGFTPPTVYAHFGSKRRLFEGLVGLVLDELFSTLRRPHPEGLSLAQDLELRVRDVFELAERQRDAFALLLLHPYDLPRLDEHGDTERVLRRHWEDVFAGHQGELGDRTPRESALVLEGVVSAWVKSWVVSADGELAPEARRVVDLVLNGVSPGP